MPEDNNDVLLTVQSIMLNFTAVSSAMMETWDFCTKNGIYDKNSVADFVKFFTLWNISGIIASGMQKYKSGSGGEDYNQYDRQFAFWTCYWNDKAKLGLSSEECINTANWMKATAFIETEMYYGADPYGKHKTDGIMQVEGPTLKVAKDLGYITKGFFTNYSNKLGGNINAALYAGIGVWVMCLSAWQGTDGGMATPINESKTEFYQYKKLDDWLSQRRQKNGGYKKVLIGDERYKHASDTYGGAGYNKNHENVQSLKDPVFRPYSVAIHKLLAEGRNPYSYQDEGATGDRYEKDFVLP